jgi:hypothetical protein
MCPQATNPQDNCPSLELKKRYSPRLSVRPHPRAMHGFLAPERDVHTKVHETVCFPSFGPDCGYSTPRYFLHGLEENEQSWLRWKVKRTMNCGP